MKTTEPGGESATVIEVSRADLISGTPAPASASPVETPAPQTPAPAETPAPSTEGNPFAGQLDSLKREFHPAKFRLKEGKPQVDTQGRFVPLGLGRKTEAASSAETPRPPASFVPPDEPDAPDLVVTEEFAVETGISLVQNALVMIGEEEGELSAPEIKMLKGPLVRCLKKYEVVGKVMTPELELATVVALLVMRRARKPKTQTWIQGKLLDLRSWWVRRKLASSPLPRPVERETVHQPAPGPEAAADYLRRQSS